MAMARGLSTLIHEWETPWNNIDQNLGQRQGEGDLCFFSNIQNTRMKYFFLIEYLNAPNLQWYFYKDNYPKAN